MYFFLFTFTNIRTNIMDGFIMCITGPFPKLRQIIQIGSKLMNSDINEHIYHFYPMNITFKKIKYI